MSSLTQPPTITKSKLLKRKFNDQDKLYFEEVLTTDGLDGGFVKVSKNPMFHKKQGPKRFFTYNQKEDTMYICTFIEEDFIEKQENYDCAKQNNSQSSWRSIFMDPKDSYFSWVVITDYHIIAKFRIKGQAGMHLRSRIRFLATYGRLPVLKKTKGFDFTAFNSGEIFYIDFTKGTIIPKRGFLKPYLKYSLKKKYVDKDKVYQVNEEINFSDEDGEINLKFLIKFQYRRKKFVNQHGDNSEIVFKITNPLLYHEYWYRELVSSGDFITYDYDSDHKYKVNIENYYTTYLPNEAYTPEVLSSLKTEVLNVQQEPADS